MSPEALRILEQTCWVLAGAAGIAGAWFVVLDRAQADQDKLQVHYRARWQRIQSSGLLELPELAVEWLLGAKERFLKYGQRIPSTIPLWAPWVPWALLTLLCVTTVLGFGIFFFLEGKEFTVGKSSTNTLYLIMVLSLLFSIIFWAVNRSTPKTMSDILVLSLTVSILVMVVAFMLAAVLNLPLIISGFVIILLTPFLSLFII